MSARVRPKPTSVDHDPQLGLEEPVRDSNLLTGLKKLGHIIVHLRRQWIFLAGILLCVYSLIINGSSLRRRSRLNYQLSGFQCDASCSFLCGLNASSFTDMDRGVVTEHRYAPRRPYFPTTVTARHLRIRSHPNETWWLNPRERPTYCQWGWPSYANKEPEEATISDKYSGHPTKTRYWTELPEKFFYTPWDEAQNMLTRTPDPVITATYQPHVMYHYMAPFIWAGVAITLGSLLRTLTRMAPYRYGSVRYILELEQLVDSTMRQRQNVLFISLWLCMCLLFYVFANLTGAISGTFLITGSLIFLANGIGAYNLATEATPITPDMVAACPDDLSIPLSWHTPNTLTVAQLFAVLLVPYKALRRAKETPEGTAALADHVDTWIIENLSLHELQRIRAMWAPLHKATRARDASQEGRRCSDEAHLSVSDVSHSDACASSVASEASGDDPGTPPPVDDRGGGHVELVTTAVPDHSGSTPTGTHPFPFLSSRLRLLRSASKPARPSYQGPRHPLLAPLLRACHLCISLKEHWILWLSVLSSAYSLLGVAAPRLREVTHCLCTCDASTPTFQDCYANQQAHAAAWMRARSVAMHVLSGVFALCIGTKLMIDYYQVRGVAYGTLEYVLRLELNKRSRPNRLLYAVTSVCVLGVTITCLVIAAVRLAQDGRTLQALLIIPLDIGLQAIACFILFTEAGFLTPASISDVPTIHLPMRCTQASDFVLSKLLRFTILTEEEVMALPDHPELIKKHRLNWLLGTRLAPADILAIQRFLRREGLGRAGPRDKLGRKKVAKIFVAPEVPIPENGEAVGGEDVGPAFAEGAGSAEGGGHIRLSLQGDKAVLL